MEMLGEALWVTALAGMGGTGMGGLLACLFRRGSGRVVSALLSFAAGVMTAVVCFDLLSSAAGDGTWRQLAWAAGGVLTGYGTTGLLNALLRGGGTAAGRSGLFLAGLVMAAAIALHNVPEGMAIGASFARAGAARRSGAALAAVIGLHNVPEGMAVAVPLMAGGGGGCGLS